MKTSCCILFALLFLGLAGCKDATLGPDLVGDLEGTVLDYATSEPLGHVSVSTSPPSNAVTTDEAGRFRLEAVAAGNYTITARCPGYRVATASIAVRENRVTEATIFLEAADEDTTSAKAALEAEVTRWVHRTSGDSVFVEVDYRARNTGEADIAAYEIYFRIDAGEASVYHEVPGDSLRAHQADVGRFERYLGAHEAQDVVVDDVWFSE